MRVGPRQAGDTFPGRLQHEGHTVTVVAVDMPAAREYGGQVEIVGNFDTWVECSCGEAWKYVPAEYDPQEKDRW